MKKLLIITLALMCLSLASCSDDEPQKELHNHDDDIQQTESVTDNGADKDDNAENNEKPYKTQEEIDAETKVRKENAQKAMEILEAVPQYPEGYPTLKDVAEVYEKANMAIGWIISTEPMAVYDDDTIVSNGIEYKRVRPDCHYGEHALKHHADKLGETQKLIYDKKTLEAYLSTLINPEEAKEYMEDAKDLKKFAVDKAGNLYVLPFSYTPSGYGEENYTLDDNGDGTYTFNVKYTLVDEDGNVYKNRQESFDFVQIDGRWLFDDFRVIRQ